jgi:hypothetical protein
MTQSQWDTIDRIILQMNPAEKQELIARVKAALSPEPTPEEIDAQHRAMDELLDRMDKLPVMNPDDGFTSADHDKVLYGRPA